MVSKTELMVTWKDIKWKKFHRHVFRLQKRIFKASQRGDVGTMRRLQKMLMKSYAAKCLAVRRVTQDNQGKSTAGVDGVKSLTPQQRLELVSTLKLGTKARATRRVMIPKPGKAEKRPLGIPTMYDRALQCLVKLALEPEWEAKFEVNSYGFRPGRSCHDAIAAIYLSINKKPKYVLDADIAKCFDQIDHNRLLEKLNTFPGIRRQIKSWLKAGYLLNRQWEPTHAGTPQGGVISPVLANIALHGLETAIRKAYYPNLSSQKQEKLGVIRYADDFVVLHQDYEKACWLTSHARTPIVRHKKIQGDRSPFDGDLIYWSTRFGEHPEMDATVSKLLKRQGGKCTYCRLNFMDGDLLEKDHVIPRSLGGKNSQNNLELLHRHCHDMKTANDGSLVNSNVKETVK